MRRLIAAACGRGKRRSCQRKAAQLASKAALNGAGCQADERQLNRRAHFVRLAASSLVTGKCFFTMSLMKHDLAARS
jgi:hypothetical protein